MKGVGGDAPSTFWNPRADQATLRQMADKVVKRHFDIAKGRKCWTTQCWGSSKVELVKGRNKEAVVKVLLDRWNLDLTIMRRLKQEERRHRTIIRRLGHEEAMLLAFNNNDDPELFEALQAIEGASLNP